MASDMANPIPDQQALQAIVEKSGDGFLVVDEERIIRFCNSAAVSILNQKSSELLGRPFEYPLKQGQNLEIGIVRENGKAGIGEFRTVDIEWHGQKAFLVSIRDISERILFDRLKDDFISNVSHELRTPLAAIRESVSLIKDGILGGVTDEQKKFLSICVRNADHLRRIVDTLLDISKIEAGKVRLGKKKGELGEIVQTTSEVFKPVAQKKGLTLEISVPKTPIEVFVDRDRIVQVLNNMIGNAIKFTRDGTIRVEVTEKADQAECAVSDKGRGISKEDLPKVFGKFQQFGKMADPENKGTGLGLAISKEIICLHGGDISVQSELDRGSTFAFTLPRYKPELEVLDHLQNRIQDYREPFLFFCIHLHETQVLEKTIGSLWLEKIARKIHKTLESSFKSVSSIRLEPDHVFLALEAAHGNGLGPNRKLLRGIKEACFDLGIDGELNFSYGAAACPKDGESPEALLKACRKKLSHEKTERLNKTIMIVDDEKALTEATRTLLELFGYRNILIAYNGPSAFEMLKKRIPDLMILDMKMPIMTGYEVIGRLKEHHETKDIPILIMSGFEVEIGRFLEYINRKAILTINKPADPDLLRKMVYYLI
jgi:signal transduction histidine kinase/CheY-like chemotaxis protein